MVATFTPLRSSAKAMEYYEREGYYAKNDPEHRKGSFWFGEGAAEVGLRGHVHPKRFEEMLQGVVPRTGLQLGRMREGEREHRPGWDLTLSPPKSVSLLALLHGDRRVMRAHDDAVRATLAWIERELLQTRGWDPATRRRPRVKAFRMVVAGFRHLTNRNLEPQLHTHCIIANMAQDRWGNWKSLDPTAMQRNERVIGALYRSELARRLQALGMATVPTMIGGVPGFELAGFERRTLDGFSSRRREIVKYLERHGLADTRRNTQRAALATRAAKREVPIEVLVPAWREMARELGHRLRTWELMPDPPRDPETGEPAPRPRVEPPVADGRALRALRRAPALPTLPKDGLDGLEAAPGAERAAAPPARLPDPEVGVLEAVARAVAHHGERRTVIPEAAIRAMVLGHAPGRHTLDEIDAAVGRLVDGGDLVETERRGVDRAFVTSRAVTSERKVLEMMRAGRGGGPRLADRRALEMRLEGGRLTDGQREAARTVLLSDDWLVGVQGHAGSGKTTMLRTVRESLGATRILGLAPSAAAARVLRDEAGIEARTLASFLLRHGDLSDPERLRRARAELSGAVLAVDEASMIGTVAMERLLRTARRLGVARVALVGDTRQLRAVDAGQPFRLLQRAGMTVARMTEVLRQRDPELLEAVGNAREGAPEAAVRGLGPRVREAARGDLGREAAREWLAMPGRERAGAMILVPTHMIRRQANEAVREGLDDEGVLHGRTLAIDRLVSRRMTRAQAADIATYEPGDTVAFHRDAYGRSDGDVCTVTRTDGGEVVLVDGAGGESRFRPAGNAVNYLQLYDTERIEIRAGDRIRWTRNRRSPSRSTTPDLVNGEEAVVLGIGRRRVRFRDGRGRRFSLARTDPQMRHLDHAYASTVHAAQGRTARTAIAVLDADGAADQAMFHVQVSRASEAFLLLTDDREALIETLERRPVREGSALEALGVDPAPPPTVDPEVFEALAADWRELRREAGESGEAAFLLPGYRQVMERAARLGEVEGLPVDMRRLVDAMLEEDAGHRARAGELGRLIDGLRSQIRRWPELNWVRRARRPAAGGGVPGHDAWRRDGAELMERARAALGEGGGLAPHLAAMPDRRAALERGLESLERVRLMDDVDRFRDRWMDLRERARGAGVPEIHCDGYEETAEAGERLLEAGGLGAEDRATVEGWRAAHDGQTRLAQEVRALPGEVEAWRERRAGGLPPAAEGAADPDLPERRAWRDDGERLKARAEAMLDPGSVHGPHLDAIPGARGAVVEARGEVAAALRAAERADLSWLTQTVMDAAERDGVEAFHLPRYGELIARARALASDAGLPEDTRKGVDAWISYDDRSAALVDEIRAWPGQARALHAAHPGPDADPGDMASWRGEAADLLARARAMQAGGGHARHLSAMPDERAELDDAARQLTGTLLEVAVVETNRLADIAEVEAQQADIAVFETGSWDEALKLARALDGRDGLSADLHADVQRHLDRQGRWDGERQRIGAFLDRAARAAEERERLDGTAGRQPGSPEERGWIENAREVRGEGDRIRDLVSPQNLAGHLRALRRTVDEIERWDGWLARTLSGVEVARAGPVSETDERSAMADDDPYAGIGPTGHTDGTRREDRQGQKRRPDRGISM